MLCIAKSGDTILQSILNSDALYTSPMYQHWRSVLYISFLIQTSTTTLDIVLSLNECSVYNVFESKVYCYFIRMYLVHLGNVVDNKLSDLKDINAKKGHFIASVNWFVGIFRGKVPIECYIRLFQSYCCTHYGSILWPLHDRGFNDFCVTWNKGVRRMLNVSNMTHTALLGEIINTCHISIQLVKRFCKFVDLMLTSCNAIVRHFVRRAINSAQSPIGRNIAVIRHRYAICVVDINVKHVHRQYPSSQPELIRNRPVYLGIIVRVQ